MEPFQIKSYDSYRKISWRWSRSWSRSQSSPNYGVLGGQDRRGGQDSGTRGRMKLQVNRYCSPNRACTDGVLTVLPSSLHLLNFEVRECHGKTVRNPPPPPAWESGKLEIQESGNLKSKNIPSIKIIRMKIRSARNVGKVLIEWKKSSLFHLGQICP